jgi:hypothetical protein
LAAGLLSSQYPLPAFSVVLGILTEHPLEATPKLKLLRDEVS